MRVRHSVARRSVSPSHSVASDPQQVGMLPRVPTPPTRPSLYPGTLWVHCSFNLPLQPPGAHSSCSRCQGVLESVCRDRAAKTSMGLAAAPREVVVLGRHGFCNDRTLSGHLQSHPAVASEHRGPTSTSRCFQRIFEAVTAGKSVLLHCREGQGIALDTCECVLRFAGLQVTRAR